MKPQEIAQLKRQSPALQQALKGHRDEVWSFLRDQVRYCYGYYLQDQFECERCAALAYTLKSPYNSWHPGWCIECVLTGFFTDAPIYKSPEELEGERRQEQYISTLYCPPPWELPDWPEDYDGPPIAWS